jgi:hypothetical protein
MKSFNAYGQTAKDFGGNVPVWLGVVRPLPTGAVLEAEFVKAGALYNAGMPVIYNAEDKTFAPCTSGTVANANAYLYNDIYIDEVGENTAATGAIVMVHGEGLLIDRTGFGDNAEALQAKIPGVVLIRG